MQTFTNQDPGQKIDCLDDIAQVVQNDSHVKKPGGVKKTLKEGNGVQACPNP